MAKQELGPKQLKWVEMLESGEFKQVNGCLTDGSSYCCLGVACLSVGMSVGDEGFKPEFDDSLPPSVRDALRLRGIMGDARGGLFQDLYELNDNEGKTFPEIAAIIRANPEQYFSEPA